jgi:hypothetical protein
MIKNIWIAIKQYFLNEKEILLMKTNGTGPGGSPRSCKCCSKNWYGGPK